MKRDLTTQKGIFDWLVEGMEEESRLERSGDAERIRALLQKFKTEPLVTGNTRPPTPSLPPINPHQLFKPEEVAAFLSVSYDTAVRVMERMKRSANLAKPRAKKRLLRVRGSDLLDFIQGKLV